MIRKLTIRYNSTAATPATHGARGYGLNVPMIQTPEADYWTVTGPLDAMRAHIQRAAAADDLNAYTIR